jgi:hypothetical protein
VATPEAGGRIGILSDIHYASPAEQSRGNDFEWRDLSNPALRLLVRMHRRYVWMREPLNQNFRLERFLIRNEEYDLLVANGDYSCNSAHVGVSDDAACQSAFQCLASLRNRYGTKLRAVIGDHELGKVSFVGGRGGMRLASWRRATGELGLEPFWKLELGPYTLFGVTSSLIALPVYEADTLPEERSEWQKLRKQHLEQIETAFKSLEPERKVLLFCHDPTALPFLKELQAVGAKLAQIEQTIIGHLHSSLVLRASGWLAGMPRIDFLGHTARRLSHALGQARNWSGFSLRLCPALGGIQLLKDGGYLSCRLDLEGRIPARFQLHRMA